MKRYFVNPLDDKIKTDFHEASILLSGLVDKGINIFSLISSSAFAIEYNASFFLLLRNYIAYIDSISILVEESSPEAIQLVLRSMLELDVNIRYMLLNDTTNKALAYQVVYSNEKIKKYRRMDENTSDGSAFKEIWSKDPITSKITFPTINSIEESRFLISMLECEPFATVNKEYNETKKRLRSSNPKWYSLWNGPVNIQSLFKAMNMSAVYEIYYRQFSGAVHQDTAFSNIIKLEPSGGIRWIRDPKSTYEILSMVFNTVFSLFTEVIEKIIPGYRVSFIAYYYEELREKFRYFQNLEINEK